MVSSATSIGGPAVSGFEHTFARYRGSPCVFGIANGTDSLVLTLVVWGIGPGDEVIVSANTEVPTALAVESSFYLNKNFGALGYGKLHCDHRRALCRADARSSQLPAGQQLFPRTRSDEIAS